jgi:hypothetical protein
MLKKTAAISRSKSVSMSTIMAKIFLCGLTILSSVMSLSAQHRKTSQPVMNHTVAFKLNVGNYTAKVHAIWAAQIIGAQIGLKYENTERAVKWVDSLPDAWTSTPLDDDYYYEMVTVRAFERYGPKMTIDQLGAQWLKDSCGVWGSTKLAKWAMLKGIKPPESGNPFNNKSYNTIGPQFTSDVYGAITPGMPNLAGKLARYYGHINGFAEGTDGAVFVAGLISTAFSENDSKKIVRKAASLIDSRSPYKQCLDMVIASAEKGLTASQIFDDIENKWRVEYPANNNAVANGGIVAACVWFGDGDFLKTLNLACSAADYSDADCNAANALSVVGAMRGLKAIPLKLLNGLGNRVKGDKIGPANIPPVGETLTSLAARTAKVGIEILKANGIKLENGILDIPGAQIITQPAEIFELDELVSHWNADWKIKNAMRNCYLEGNALITGPKLAPVGMYLYRNIKVSPHDTLKLCIAAETNKCWEMKVLVDNDKIYSKIIESNTAADKWQNISVDLSKYNGQTVLIRLYQNTIIEGRYTGNAYWKTISN